MKNHSNRKTSPGYFCCKKDRNRLYFHENFFYWSMTDFFNTLELNYHKYQSNGTVIEENYKGRILFIIQGFFSFGIDRQSILFMSNIFL